MPERQKACKSCSFVVRVVDKDTGKLIKDSAYCCCPGNTCPSYTTLPSGQSPVIPVACGTYRFCAQAKGYKQKSKKWAITHNPQQITMDLTKYRT